MRESIVTVVKRLEYSASCLNYRCKAFSKADSLIMIGPKGLSSLKQQEI
jgi:hypothetical protein